MNWRKYQALQKVTELGERFLSFVDWGTGDPMILLHGIPTWGYAWHRVLPMLARRNRVLVPDLLGYGFSDKRDCFDRSISKQTASLFLWMGLIGLERAHFVGHELGGGIALRMATQFPERVSGLTLIDSVCYDSWPRDSMLTFGNPDMNRSHSAAMAQRLLRSSLKPAFCGSASDELIDALLAPYSTEVGKLSLIRCASALNTNHTQELTHRLPAIQAPTRILWGDHDPFLPVSLGKRLARDIAGASLEIIPKCGHFPMLEKPEAVLTPLTKQIEEKAS